MNASFFSAGVITVAGGPISANSAVEEEGETASALEEQYCALGGGPDAPRDLGGRLQQTNSSDGPPAGRRARAARAPATTARHSLHAYIETH